jgi:hypothetical protein
VDQPLAMRQAGKSVIAIWEERDRQPNVDWRAAKPQIPANVPFIVRKLLRRQAPNTNGSRLWDERPERTEPSTGYLLIGRQPSLGRAVRGEGSVDAGFIAVAGGSKPGGKNTGRVGTG